MRRLFGNARRDQPRGTGIRQQFTSLKHRRYFSCIIMCKGNPLSVHRSTPPRPRHASKMCPRRDDRHFNAKTKKTETKIMAVSVTKNIVDRFRRMPTMPERGRINNSNGPIYGKERWKMFTS
jgi:hypothetical protein